MLGVGAIAGGWVEPHTGIIRRHDVLQWSDVDLATALATASDHRVHVDANARAHAVADIIFGDARGHANFAHLFVGHIVEASLVLDGRVYTGPQGFGGSLEDWIMDDGNGAATRVADVAADGAMTRRARDLGIIPATGTFDDLALTARTPGVHQDAAHRLLELRSERVGTLISSIVDLVGVSLVIISSGVISQPGAVEAVRRGLALSRTGKPIPELRSAEANVGSVLTRAATAVVLDATVLAGMELA